MRAVAITIVLSLAACSAPDEPSTPTTTTVSVTSLSTSTTAASSPTSATPTFASEIGPIDPSRLHASWREGCPIGPADLRLVTLSHWGFDGAVHTGHLVVHASYAEPIRDVFAALFDVRYPIAQMRLVDDFGGDDDASMAANNTSAFNCRSASGSNRWSEHAYGRAVDINPVQNPYVTSSGAVLPPEGASYVVRNDRRGVITGDGAVVAAFDAIGWEWGGRWSAAKDYQHFSSTGR